MVVDAQIKCSWNKAEQFRANRLLIVTFFFSTFILLLPIAFNFFPTRQESVGRIEKQAQNKGSEVSNGEALCEAMKKGDEISIRVWGNLTELFNYQNLFQTSDLNAGIRFEIDGSGQGALLIASSGVDGYSVLTVPKKFVVGDFDISIRIKDGSLVSVYFFNKVTEKVLTGLVPICDNFIVGSGFDSSRAIKGEIQFTAIASYFKPRFVPSWLDNAVRVDWFRALMTALFFFTALSIAFKMSDDAEDEKDRQDKKQDRV